MTGTTVEDSAAATAEQDDKGESSTSPSTTTTKRKIWDVYPLKCRVVLHGLVKAPELNGKSGVITSAIRPDGRQTVLLDGDESRSVGLKPSNMKFEGRSVDSLSVKELKKVLLMSKTSSSSSSAGASASASENDSTTDSGSAADDKDDEKTNKITEKDLIGMDKSELKAKVEELVGESPEEIAELLATKQPSSESSSSSSDKKKRGGGGGGGAGAGVGFEDLSPDQIRQQARMMKSMPPAQVRKMNPQMAHMSDAQILSMANQMEMMANNPEMLEMARSQMKSMSPAERTRMMQQQKRSMASGGGRGAGAPSEAKMISEMSPEQLKYQAQMLKNMSPDQVRSMNPQMANFTDQQISDAANQMEMMANNPEMAKMAAEQMKNMTPEQIEQAKNGTLDPSSLLGGGPGGAPPTDPSEFLKNMDKKQLKQMLTMVKDNPASLKQFSAQTGISEDQLKSGVELFANMDESKLETMIGLMQKVQQARELWNNLNAKTGGYLKWILALCVIVFMYMFIVLIIFWRKGGGDNASAAAASSSTLSTEPEPIPDIPVQQNVGGDGEFDDL